MDHFAKYRLVNQKSKGYKGLYERLFKILNKGCIFSECYDELEETIYDGEDMIVVTTWGDEEDKLPKGIIRID